MTWDGVPEHRNRRGEGEQSGADLGAQQRRQAFLDRIAESRARIQAQRPGDPAGGPSRPGEGAMPPDPFSSNLPGAIAQAEMLHSLIEGGFTEPQALYYLACLVQVGLAMQLGRLTGELPPWPPQAP